MRSNENGTQVISAWVLISEYMKLSGLGKTAILNRMRNGQLKWKYMKGGLRGIQCKLTMNF